MVRTEFAFVKARRPSHWCPGIPTLSSAQSPWEGALLECHAYAPYSADKHQHTSHFVCLELSESAPFVWVMSRGTEHSVSFPKPAKRILLNLEPNLLQQALSENTRGSDVELANQWGRQDTQVEYILRALEADLQAGLPGAGSSESPCSVRSLCIFNAVMVWLRQEVQNRAMTFRDSASTG